MSIPPPGFNAAPIPTVTPPVTESDWSAKLPAVMTFRQGFDALTKVRNYAWAVIDKIAHGTAPPPSALAPELVKRIKAMDIAREGFGVMVKKGSGESYIPAKLRAESVKRGEAVITESNRIWAAVQAEDARIKSKLKFGGSVLGTVVIGGIVVLGIYAVAKVVGKTAETARDVRLTVRGYPGETRQIPGG